MRAQTNIEDRDMLQDALDRQEAQSKDKYEGMSMAEIAAARRAETEKKMAAMSVGGAPDKSEMEARKARLMAQREKLRAA
jgi:hypothetical protein